MKDDTQQQLAVTDAFLIILVEILIRRFGHNNTLVIENFRQDLIGAPMRFGLTAGVTVDGRDMVFHLEPLDGRVITLDDLISVEVGEAAKETVH